MATAPGSKKAAGTKKGAGAKKGAATKAAAVKKGAASRARQGGAAEVRIWQDDPGAPDATVHPVQRPAPTMGQGPLQVSIAGAGPKPALYERGTAEFRWWVAAEALQRGSELWAVLAPGLKWFGTVGPELDVQLDVGEDLNAYYDRQGLRFFHGRANGKVVYSAESPDILCHEMGHAILDGLRPQLFHASYIEVGALHESFGDMAAILCALELQSVREEVLAETAGHLSRSSRVSRVAEQLGWAIRTVAPDAVEPDCLRNAVNSFFYQVPEQLPPSGPANTLSSEPHSFSRVFTAAFLDALSTMLRSRPTQDEATLAEVARQIGTLLVDAVIASPVVPTYFSQMAAHMIDADVARYGGRNGEALKAAFVRRGVLSLESANTLHLSPAGPRSAARGMGMASTAGVDSPQLYTVALAGQRYGLNEDLLVPAIAQTKRFGVVGSAPDVGGADAPAHDRAAASFVEDLFRRGKVDVAGVAEAPALASVRPSKRSHEVKREDQGLMLTRRLFDCMPDASG